MHRTILLTGFEPFGGDLINPSWEACLLLEGEKIGDYTIHVKQLSCVFHESLKQLEAYILGLNPSIILCTGLATGRPDITIERIGINVDDARIEDNKKNQPIDKAIDVSGPAAYFATVPIKAMVQTIRQAGIPASVSQTAGTFVCNHVLYGVLNLLAQTKNPARAGFIHIPALPSMTAHSPSIPTMSTESVAIGLRAALHACTENEQDMNLSDGTIC